MSQMESYNNNKSTDHCESGAKGVLPNAWVSSSVNEEVSSENCFSGKNLVKFRTWLNYTVRIPFERISDTAIGNMIEDLDVGIENLNFIEIPKSIDLKRIECSHIESAFKSNICVLSMTDSRDWSENELKFFDWLDYPIKKFTREDERNRTYAPFMIKGSYRDFDDTYMEFLMPLEKCNKTKRRIQQKRETYSSYEPYDDEYDLDNDYEDDKHSELIESLNPDEKDFSL
jgi:hypothetical protein